MPRRSSPPLLRRQLGARLREHREAAGLRTGDVAASLGINASIVSRLEHGHRRPIVLYVKALCDHYGLDASTTENLEALARAAYQSAWWDKFDAAAGMGEYVGFEAGAAEIRAYEVGYIPGLLQTREYARLALHSPGSNLTDQQLAKAVEFRMRRQAILTAEDPAKAHFVLSEAVLLHDSGEARKSQIEALIGFAELPNVVIQVLPFAAQVPHRLASAYSILMFADELTPDMVYAETVLGGSARTEVREVETCQRLFAEQVAASASATDSLRMLKNEAFRVTARVLTVAARLSGMDTPEPSEVQRKSAEPR